MGKFGVIKIGQQEIIEILEKHNKPISRREIAEELNIPAQIVSRHIQKLLLHNEIKCIEIDRNQARAYFKERLPSRRMRLYYL